jgi:hypothetical protein
LFLNGYKDVTYERKKLGRERVKCGGDKGGEGKMI